MTPSEPTSQDPGTIPDIPHEAPLQGWKEIAVFLDRDVSTARRWEREAGLPIRRHRTDRRSSVYAYASEIEAWRAARPPQSERTEPRVWRKPKAWASLGLTVAAGLAVAYGPILNPRNPIAEAAEDSMRAEQVWTDAAADYSSRLSPDGKLITYTDWSSGELWLRDVETGVSRVVTNDGSWETSRSFPETSAVSPDGTRVAAGWYNDEIENYELRVGPLPGPGEAHNGVSLVQTPEGSAGYVEAVGWLSSSRVLFVHSFGFSTTRLAVADLETEKTTTLDEVEIGYPADVAISPDGQWIAYGGRAAGSSRQHDIILVASDGSTKNTVVVHPSDDLPVAWTPDGSHLLFRSARAAGQSLWAIPMADGAPAGDARMISPDVSIWRPLGLSAGGELFYLKRTGSKDILEAEIDIESGRVTREPTPVSVSYVGDNRDPRYSPDGKLIAYLSNRALYAIGSFGDRVVVVRDLQTGRETDLEEPSLSISEFNWAPDSQSVLVKGRTREGRFGAYRFDVGGDQAELLFQLDERKKGNPRNFGWMQDGRSIFYLDRATKEHMLRDLSTDETTPLMKHEGNARLALSPDGDRFALIEHRTAENTARLAIRDIDLGGERELARFEVDEGNCCPPLHVEWTAGGTRILYWRNPSGGRRNAAGYKETAELWVADADGSSARNTGLSVRDLARPNMTVSLHPDGKRIAFSAGNQRYEVWTLSNFLDRLTASD